MSDNGHVLVVGGTGRTGRRLVRRLLEDERVSEVTIVVRDPEKAQVLFGGVDEHMDRLNVVEGDLVDVDSWAPRLHDVSQVVTAVS